MKNVAYILIIFFVIVSVYTLQDDILKFANRLINQPEVVVDEVFGLNSESNSLEIEKKISNPGPLRQYKKVSKDSAVLTELGIIQWTNVQRIQNGNLLSLSNNQKLNESAKKKLDNMFDQQYFEHNSPDGLGAGDLGEKVGYDFILMGENLAMGNFKDDQNLIQEWMNSPGHRANILNERYLEIGVAVGKELFEGKEVWLAVQHFGLPASTCPSIDQELKVRIQINQKEIDDTSISLSFLEKELKKLESIMSFNYNEKVNNFNSLVEEYNNLVNKTKIDIEVYNNQVKAFNSCAEGPVLNN